MAHPTLEPFLEMLLVERGASRNTVDAYKRDLASFFEQCADPLNATEQEIKTYLHVLSQQGMAPSSRARKLSSLRQYFRFLQAEGILQEDPTFTLEGPKRDKPLPKVLSEQEIERLLQVTQSLPEKEAKRLLCLLELSYASGLRVSELVSLSLRSIEQVLKHPGHPAMIIRGKGNKERLVPLTQTALLATQAYLETRKHFLKLKETSPFLFPSPAKEGHLTRQRFGQLLKQLAIKAGISPSKISPHVLRHAFATHLLHHGADLVSVQKLLGHSDISTTEIYTHLMTEQMQDFVAEYHPLSKKAKRSRKAEG